MRQTYAMYSACIDSPPVGLSDFSQVLSRKEQKCHRRKSVDCTRFNTSIISRHRTDKSLRTDNKGFIVLKNPNHNNRQSLIRLRAFFVTNPLSSLCSLDKNGEYQEPITRSLQLPHIPVTAFSQTDLFLV